jgi:hypothetical protein
MRVSIVLLTAVGTAAILLSACSSAPQASTAGLLPTGANGSHSGVTNPVFPNRGKASLILRKLYVTDNKNADVALFKYRTWTSLGTIASGVTSPYGDWVDKNGNLYVANRQQTSDTGEILEYDSSANLIFTYSAGIKLPVSVATDKVGNVYEADETGTVNEYPQGSNAVAATCSLQAGDDVLGVAVNGRGGVFVTYRTGGSSGSGSGGIYVFPRGLNGGPYACTNALLPVKFAEPFGIIFDKQGNLLVCDASPYAPAVDIIAPPYKNITGTLGSGWVDPFFITIDRAGTQVYVTDAGARDVSVFTYPGGMNVATLGSANGLTLPVEAVDSKNYVP